MYPQADTSSSLSQSICLSQSLMSVQVHERKVGGILARNHTQRISYAHDYTQSRTSIPMAHPHTCVQTHLRARYIHALYVYMCVCMCVHWIRHVPTADCPNCQVRESTLRTFYRRRNPEKIDTISKILNSTKRTDAQLIKQLKDKYVEPHPLLRWKEQPQPINTPKSNNDHTS